MRAEVVGPAQPSTEASIVAFENSLCSDTVVGRRGAAFWRPVPHAALEEVLYFDGETPHRKYGAGLLHPEEVAARADPALVAVEETDTRGVDSEAPDGSEEEASDSDDEEGGDDDDEFPAGEEEFEATSPDIGRPSSIGISCCVTLPLGGVVSVRLPNANRFSWQSDEAARLQVNGRYEQVNRSSKDEKGVSHDRPVWRRHPAVPEDCVARIAASELAAGEVIRRSVDHLAGPPIRLRVDVFSRPVKEKADTWLLTIVLRNVTPPTSRDTKEAILYQTFFEVAVEGGSFSKYPESERPFVDLDDDEQSLVLLYRDAATWAIGHGCAAGWDTMPGNIPSRVFADVLPAVETPSMTPDIVDASGEPIRLSMRELSDLSDDGGSVGWSRLDTLVQAYRDWIEQQRNEARKIEHEDLRSVAQRHSQGCVDCLRRIEGGVQLLRTDPTVLHAFRLANRAMLLQQISTKQLGRRALEVVWSGKLPKIRPLGEYLAPSTLLAENQEDGNIGMWRAFQTAFLLMQLAGLSDGNGPERRIVDLIWFPTGGGKTEAYLGAMAFYMFHQRLVMAADPDGLPRDGTNVLMRYTLRMLTTQQFQRAASLICAMEYLRRRPETHGLGVIPGKRFAVALWIGSGGAPNKTADAKLQLNAYRNGERPGNPLVLTECPWCRAALGRLDGQTPRGVTEKQWNEWRVIGVADRGSEGPLLHCSDASCEFGAENWTDWLPVEVIDERIYKTAPSLVIATADKFALLAYRPQAGALFGRKKVNGSMQQVSRPPGMIVQDELHLIAGPLGTMYGLYEGIIERLCTVTEAGLDVVPKIIASTATIRGAADQVKALYARVDHTTGSGLVKLFPSPGLQMGDSFFGVYAKNENGSLAHGRLYLGLHASDYGSILTAQVRAFSSVLYEAGRLGPSACDPWWTLLVFYNSLRELGGAKTLFDSDIRSRLRFLQNREGVQPDDRRNLRIVEELTSRLSQSEIVEMLDRLSEVYNASNNRAFDACLASSIIEVGVDIDRLSLMAVVGQPKTTAQYIQVSGRVGRRWKDRPGLVLMIYNPRKSRDRSHFEQFHSYHGRLYERVEPTSVTPFAPSALQRGLAGALLTWARQHSTADVADVHNYTGAVEHAFELLRERCETVQRSEDLPRSLEAMERIRDDLMKKWGRNPQKWEDFPPSPTEEYLLLWPGQFASFAQRQNGVEIPSSMRQVDGSAELAITQGYTPKTIPPAE